MMSREHAQSKPNSNGPLITAHVKLAIENKSVTGSARGSFKIKARYVTTEYLGNQKMKKVQSMIFHYGYSVFCQYIRRLKYT